MDKGIGTKIEMTNIREIEEHPIVVDVILKDGYRATLIFDITLKVFEPLKLVPRKGFLTYVQQEFNDIVAPWANKKKDIDSILQLEIEEVDKDVIFDIYGVKDSLRNYLDSKKFEPFGFRIKELSLRVGIPSESYSYFEIKNKKKHEEAELKRLKSVELRKKKEREIFRNDADNERSIQEKDLAVTGNYQTRIIKEIYDGQERVAGAYKANVLVLNGKDSKDEDETKMLTSSIIGNLVDYKKMEKGE